MSRCTNHLKPWRPARNSLSGIGVGLAESLALTALFELLSRHPQVFQVEGEGAAAQHRLIQDLKG